jgi:hypothetical protein
MSEFFRLESLQESEVAEYLSKFIVENGAQNALESVFFHVELGVSDKREL